MSTDSFGMCVFISTWAYFCIQCLRRCSVLFFFCWTISVPCQFRASPPMQTEDDRKKKNPEDADAYNVGTEDENTHRLHVTGVCWNNQRVNMHVSLDSFSAILLALLSLKALWKHYNPETGTFLLFIFPMPCVFSV